MSYISWKTDIYLKPKHKCKCRSCRLRQKSYTYVSLSVAGELIMCTMYAIYNNPWCIYFFCVLDISPIKPKDLMQLTMLSASWKYHKYYRFHHIFFHSISLFTILHQLTLPPPNYDCVIYSLLVDSKWKSLYYDRHV